MRNTARSFWLSWLLLPLIFLAGDRLAGYFLRQTIENAQFRYARLYRREGAPEILLLGNSRGLTFYQPYISEKTGQNNLNLSYNGLPMDVGNAGSITGHFFGILLPFPNHDVLIGFFDE